jgi:hypothetical protein
MACKQVMDFAGIQRILQFDSQTRAQFVSFNFPGKLI